MTISFKKYVDITSGVGAGASVRTRDLIGRIYTSNPALPVGTYIDSISIEDVGAVFGIDSEEYKRATLYLGWISKLISKAKMISFARWTPEAAAPVIIGSKVSINLNDWVHTTDGTLTLVANGVASNITALNFSSVQSYTEVAQTLQTAIQALTDDMYKTATVVWDPVNQKFTLTGGVAGKGTLTVSSSGLNTDISQVIGWSNPTYSDGAEAESPVAALTNSTNTSNNFGSFLFMDALEWEDVVNVAKWNHAQNITFMYTICVKASDAELAYEDLKNYSGTAVALIGKDGEFHEMPPMIIQAATDYTKLNVSQNYMYQQFPLTPTVTETMISNDLDSKRINYYGRTQTAGQNLDFYQRGVLMGDAKAPVDMTTYSNEQWLKDAAGSEIMTLLLALAKVSANANGRSQLITTLQSVAEDAIDNGTISIGKELTTTQKLYITDQTNDSLAWHQVQNTGYWLNCVMRAETMQDGRVEYKAVYTLLYSKDDVVRKVEGTHTLI
ncbi:DUF3383 domain-containing protein [Jinshanibacter sp. LJY008]|uniref:DUF3383 domain-containing protein n=1 Tax=Limnobaculum eriocheiris TaxID=2897391 RepID=A0A9X1MUG2_9GAMM|nr:DUF3383 domain-containing protein [Limnobaculum eriocheiris]MCD1124810.1 DUF3383 domain-containing protein [Limnobaculum eriocheiris]